MVQCFWLIKGSKKVCRKSYHNLICTPILLLWTWISGDLEVTKHFSHLSSPGFQVVMLLSCVMSFLLNYAVFLNTTLNSALTQTICGNLKDLFIIGLGWIVFGGLPFDLVTVERGGSITWVSRILYIRLLQNQRVITHNDNMIYMSHVSCFKRYMSSFNNKDNFA